MVALMALGLGHIGYGYHNIPWRKSLEMNCRSALGCAGCRLTRVVPGGGFGTGLGTQFNTWTYQRRIAQTVLVDDMV